MIEFLEQWGVVAYGLTILFGGLVGIKYMPGKWAKMYKFFLFSLIFAAVYIILEVLVQDNFKKENATKYLLTYPVVAVLYQLFIRKLFEKFGWTDKDIEQ